MRVLVIGGGALGSAVALFLKRLAGTAVEVQVIEPDPGLRQASSARSAASIRQQFSNEVNIRMSRFGFELLADSAAGAAVLAANHRVQRAAGAAVALLSPSALAARLPWLATADLHGASLGLAGEGWFDGYAFARALAAKARALGARWLQGRVVGAERDGARLTRLLLADGSRLAADALVLAAGPWSGGVGRALGLAVPVHARKRSVFMLNCPTPLPRTPLVVDPAGVWFRSEGAGFIAGWTPGAADADPDDLPLDQPALEQFEQRLWPALATRVPAFEALRVQHAWDGYYEVHPLDHNALIGAHPDCANLALACGFSGHGLQHAAAAGRGIAEWLLLGRYDSLDLSAFSPRRVAAQAPFTEQAVI